MLRMTGTLTSTPIPLPQAPTQGSMDSLIISFRKTSLFLRVCFQYGRPWECFPGTYLRLHCVYIQVTPDVQSVSTQPHGTPGQGKCRPTSQISQLPKTLPIHYYLLRFVEVLMKWVVKARVWDNSVDFTRKEAF